MTDNAIKQQRKYYAETACEYDKLHLSEHEHQFALAQLSGYINYYSFNSLLDVGAGTGRVLRHMDSLGSSLNLMGVEPVGELRKIAYENNVPKEKLIDGDASSLNMEDDSWDIVCAFGILHHIGNPNKAVREMCRVAKYGVFFSDLNNFGCGSLAQRVFAQTLHSFKLWKSFQWLKNGGRYDKYSEEDGVHYSYSLFDSLNVVKEKFPQTFLSNTKGSSTNLYRGCSHLSVFATKSVEQLNALSTHCTPPEPSE